MKNLLIRAEDKNRWESRTPLLPKDLESIVQTTGAKVFVEDSDKRYISSAEYVSIGAISCTDMAQGDVVFGIKEIPVQKILDKKTYLFFSHTIKGQRDNMELLQKIIDSGSTLIDYEKIVNEKNQRIIFFGPYAGSAGAIDILSILGEKWASKGINTPFTKINPAHTYASLDEALKQIRSVGDEIRTQGLPEEIFPFTLGLLGYGNVSQGAQLVFNCLPVETVAPENITKKLHNHELDNKTIWLSIFKEQDLVQPINSSDKFELSEYYEHPERYQSCFEQYLNSFTLLVNAVYWSNKYPRFVTWNGLQNLENTKEKIKLEAIADISCDIKGAIECTVKSTDSDAPAYRLDISNKTICDGHVGDGIALLAVDNLPCELPHDSSSFFSKQLAPFIPNILTADYQATLVTSNLAPELKRATIVYDGELTDNYKYLQTHLDQWRDA